MWKKAFEQLGEKIWKKVFVQNLRTNLERKYAKSLFDKKKTQINIEIKQQKHFAQNFQNYIRNPLNDLWKKKWQRIVRCKMYRNKIVYAEILKIINKKIYVKICTKFLSDNKVRGFSSISNESTSNASKRRYSNTWLFWSKISDIFLIYDS